MRNVRYRVHESRRSARFAQRTEDFGTADVLRAALAPAGGLLVRVAPAEDVPDPRGR